MVGARDQEARRLMEIAAVLRAISHSRCGWRRPVIPSSRGSCNPPRQKRGRNGGPSPQGDRRSRAGAVGAWCELFARSARATRTTSTLRDVERRLPEIADLGFDVLYLAPIHPIGSTNRKGRNNALRAAAGDPGSPWAIGSDAGPYGDRS